MVLDDSIHDLLSEKITDGDIEGLKNSPLFKLLEGENQVGFVEGAVLNKIDILLDEGVSFLEIGDLNSACDRYVQIQIPYSSLTNKNNKKAMGLRISEYWNKILSKIEEIGN